VNARAKSVTGEASIKGATCTIAGPIYNENKNTNLMYCTKTQNEFCTKTFHWSSLVSLQKLATQKIAMCKLKYKSKEKEECGTAIKTCKGKPDQRRGLHQQQACC
jgi:hypothetical protein